MMLLANTWPCDLCFAVFISFLVSSRHELPTHYRCWGAAHVCCALAAPHLYQKSLDCKVGSTYPVSFDYAASFSPRISWEIGGEAAGEDEEVEWGCAGKHKVTELFHHLFWRLVRGSVGGWGSCAVTKKHQDVNCHCYNSGETTTLKKMFQKQGRHPI